MCSYTHEKIPKIIHYCWFGKGEYSKNIKDCIASWKLHLHDYDFMLWNEDNIALSHPFVKMAYNNKKWAYVSDYVRLKMLYKYGGIYLDTDMFVVKPFTRLLNNEVFLGLESSKLLNGALIGAVKKHSFVKKCLEYYDVDSPQEWQLRLAIPRVITSCLQKQEKETDFFIQSSEPVLKGGIRLYPVDYFYPYPFVIDKPFNKNFIKYATKNTYAIHLWEGSWHDYSEFQLIRKRMYLEAFKKIKKEKLFNNFLKQRYVKKFAKAIVRSFF